MDRSAINAALRQHHAAFIACIRSIPAAAMDVSPLGKWTPAQQLEHILRSVRPVSMVLLLPKWFLRRQFGVPNRTPRTYDALVERYREKLAAGGKAGGRFVPPPVAGSRVDGMTGKLHALVETLCRRVGRWNEQDLDKYLLPHPLLGRLTIREMLYFTIHHVQHHQELVERDLRNAGMDFGD